MKFYLILLFTSITFLGTINAQTPEAKYFKGKSRIYETEKAFIVDVILNRQNAFSSHNFMTLKKKIGVSTEVRVTQLSNGKMLIRYIQKKKDLLI